MKSLYGKRLKVTSTFIKKLDDNCTIAGKINLRATGIVNHSTPTLKYITIQLMLKWGLFMVKD